MCAGLALMWQKPGQRRTLALYALVRVGQCWYNARRAAGKWHFWGSDLDHADALLFAVASAQVRHQNMCMFYVGFNVGISCQRQLSAPVSVHV